MSVGSIGTALNAYSVQSVGKPAAQTTPSAVTSSKSVVVAISAKAAKIPPSNIADAIAAFEAARYAGTLDNLGPVAIVDTAKNFEDNFNFLSYVAQNGKITSVTISDKNPIFTMDAQSIGKFTDPDNQTLSLLNTLKTKITIRLNGAAYTARTMAPVPKNVALQFQITDTANELATYIDEINVLSKKSGAIRQIKVIPDGQPISLSADQYKNSTKTLSLISTPYSLDVNGVSVKDFLSLQKLTNISSMSIYDSSSNVLKYADQLKSSSKTISSITLNDKKAATFSIAQAATLRSLNNVTMATEGYNITDDALTVISHIRYDFNDIISGAKTVSINNRKPADLTVDDSVTLRGISNLSKNVKYNIVDTADAITASDNAVSVALDAAESVTISGKYTIQQAQNLLGKKKIVKDTPIAIQDTVRNILEESSKPKNGILSRARIVTVSDLVVNVASNIDKLQTLAKNNMVTNISLSDASQGLPLSIDQMSKAAEAIGKIIEKPIKYSTDNNGNKLIFGTSVSETIEGGSGNDTFYASGGSDTIDGQAGLDRLILQGNASDYTFSFTANDLSPYNINASIADTKTLKFGTHTLSSIERLVFKNNTAVALDIYGNAGKAFRLYKASYDNIPTASDITPFIKFLDDGGTLDALAAQIVQSNSFTSLYPPAISNSQFVSSLYYNILHRSGDNAGMAAFTSLLNQGWPRSKLLTIFSESMEFKVTSAPLMGNGIPYNE